MDKQAVPKQTQIKKKQIKGGTKHLLTCRGPFQLQPLFVSISAIVPSNYRQSIFFKTYKIPDTTFGSVKH